MRNSGLLKWAQPGKNNKMANGRTKEAKTWVHSPDTLLKGHVVYLVKFLGSTEVDQPKGIEVVKQGIQKLKFSQQLKKSEGNKTPKVELTISVDGVAIQEPKTKRMLHQYQLQRISYCADDKAEKRFFSFIAKEDDTNKHTCYVFVSDKLAEEITLTIGQAFELAYKRFLETSGRDIELKKQLMALQKKISSLEFENSELKTRLRDVANIKGQQDIQAYLAANKISDICQVSQPDDEGSKEVTAEVVSNGLSRPEDMKPTNFNELICLEEAEAATEQLDGFTLDDLNDEDFNPRAGGAATSEDDDDFQFDPRAVANSSGSPTNNFSPPPASAANGPMMLSPPPALPPRDPQKLIINNNVANPFSNGVGVSNDLFGMGSFDSSMPAPANGKHNNFSSGFSKPNFSLDELDPLKN